MQNRSLLQMLICYWLTGLDWQSNWRSVGKLSPVHGPCVSGVQTQALGPAHSSIHHHEPRVRVYPMNTRVYHRIFHIFIWFLPLILLVPDMFEVRKYRSKNSCTKTEPAPSESKSDARRWSLPVSYAHANTTRRLQPRRRAQGRVCLSPAHWHAAASSCILTHLPSRCSAYTSIALNLYCILHTRKLLSLREAAGLASKGWTFPWKDIV